MITKQEIKVVKNYLFQFTEYLKDYIKSKIESENHIELIYTLKHWCRAFNSDLRLAIELSSIKEGDIDKEQRKELFHFWSNAIVTMLSKLRREYRYLIDFDNNNTIYIITP